MDADLSKPDGALAQVTNDATVANNQSYRKSGAAGAGSWVASVDRLANALGNGSGFQQSGAGAVLRAFQDKARDVISVKDFGAKGDGATDDTAAVQAFVTYLCTNHIYGFVPAGTYLLSAKINFTGTYGWGIVGAGR
jgi:hypothetical protein